MSGRSLAVDGACVLNLVAVLGGTGASGDVQRSIARALVIPAARDTEPAWLDKQLGPPFNSAGRKAVFVAPPQPVGSSALAGRLETG
jgi:hypothetical protein